MTTNWTKESLQTEVDSKAEVVDAVFCAERRERERLVWIEFMLALKDPVMADNALKEYVQRWEE